MPFQTLKLLPGVNLERSATLNKLQLAATNLCRFYGGLVQKLGGWLQLTGQTFIGICRGLHGWADIIGNSYLAVGTDQRLAVLIGGALADITPLVATENPAVSFSTVAGTPNVTIQDVTYNPAVGDWIGLLTQVSVGGIVLVGYYRVVAVPDGTHYTIMATSNATSTVIGGGAVPVYETTAASASVHVLLFDHGFSVGSIFNAGVSTTVSTVVVSGFYSVATVADSNNFTIIASTLAAGAAIGSENGGNARIQYLLPSGFQVTTYLSGYGVGDYGLGDYGLANSSTSIGFMRQWSLDHFGQDLIASPTNGAIYFWQPPVTAPAAVVDASAPRFNIAVFVMPQVQIIVALGAETGSVQEPKLIRWCDAGDFTGWTPSATNQAGSFEIPSGSRLVGGLAVGLGALVWTDIDIWSMTYEGLPFVFGFNRISIAASLIAMRAAGAIGSIVVWLSTRGFYSYNIGGGVTPMECPVWDFLINNIDFMQLDQIHCAVNALFNEMAWHFPIAQSSPLWSASTTFGYVKLNLVEPNAWDFGISAQYQRTAWAPLSPIGNPVGADLVGLLQQHEQGYDANGVGMIWSWETGYFDLMDGEQFAFCDLLIPDNVTVGNPTINYTINVVRYPNDAPTVIGPFISNDQTEFIPVRARGRQMAIGASGSDLGSFNRLGAFRYRYAADGRQ